MAVIVTLTVNPSCRPPSSVLRPSISRDAPPNAAIRVEAASTWLAWGADVTAIYPAGGALGQGLRRIRKEFRGLKLPFWGNARGFHGHRTSDRPAIPM